MSDYLSDLARMIAAEGPRVRPRLAARFEPTQPALGPAFAWDVNVPESENPDVGIVGEAETTDAKPVPLSGPPVRSPQPRLPAEDTSAAAPHGRLHPTATAADQPKIDGPAVPRSTRQAQSGSRPEAAEPRAVPSSGVDQVQPRVRTMPPATEEAAPEPAPPVSAAPPAIEARRRSSAAPEPAAPSRPGAISPAATDEAPPARRSFEPTVSHRPQLATAPSAPAVEVSPAPPVIPHQAEVRRDPVTQTPGPRTDQPAEVEPAPSADTQPPAVPPTREIPVEPTPIRPMADGPARQRREAQPAPTIRVTIGRIEVRATTPPTPKPPPRPARREPTVSLDQYLEQRNGGHR